VENLIKMDNIDWRGYRVRIQKPWKFFSDYNDTEGNNVRKIANKRSASSLFETDNKLFIGGIPVTAKEKEVREILESFGMLKTFNLVRDPNDENLNRGFAFFEYANENDTEKALKVKYYL
jgi:splicing factor U2AF subunit